MRHSLQIVVNPWFPNLGLAAPIRADEIPDVLTRGADPLYEAFTAGSEPFLSIIFLVL